jgi:hypothetical protein
MAGKKKDMKGGVDNKNIKRINTILDELNEYYSLLTKQKQGMFNGMFNKVRFESRLKNFFELLKKILSEDLLSKLYINNLDGQLAKLLELFVKFKNISLIKNGGSQEILNLFRLNIMWMTKNAKDTFTEFSQLIMRNIELFKAKTRNRYGRPLAESITKEDLENVEKSFDFVIGLINYLVGTFGKNTSKSPNYELAEIERYFDNMINEYLIYIQHLKQNQNLLPLDFQISKILLKRKLSLDSTVSNYQKQMKELKNAYFPTIQQVETQQPQHRISKAQQLKNKSQNNNSRYELILQELEERYPNNVNYIGSLPGRLPTLALIAFEIESIKNLNNSNNRNFLIEKLKAKIGKFKNTLGKYPEFKEYERFIISANMND